MREGLWGAQDHDSGALHTEVYLLSGGLGRLPVPDVPQQPGAERRVARTLHALGVGDEGGELVQGQSVGVGGECRIHLLEQIALRLRGGGHRELGKQGVYMPGFTSQDHVAAIQTFAAGKAAMLYNGSWWAGVVGGVDQGFNVDVIPLPLMDGVDEIKCVQMSSDHGMIINSKTKSMDAAIRFLDYYTQEEGCIIRSNVGNYFSVYPGANEKLSLDPLFLKPAITDQFKKPTTGVFFDWAFPTPVIEVIKTRIPMAIDGQITIEQALADIQAEQDKYLTK